MIPLGFFTSATAAFEHIQTVNFSSSTSSVTFSNIPQNFKHLQIRWTAARASLGNEALLVRFNGDNASAYTNLQIGATANGTTLTSSMTMGQPEISLNSALSSDNVSYFGSGIMDFLEYTSTTKTKTTRAFYGAYGSTIANRGAFQHVGLYDFPSNPITSIEFRSTSAAIGIGSRFSLYGIGG